MARTRSIIEGKGEKGPRKRARTSHSSIMGEISFLNQTGISHLDSGKEAEAEQCFSRALNLINEKMLSPHDNDPCSLASREKRKKASMIALARPFEDEQEKKTNRQTPSYIYQQSKYDEGMLAYGQALSIDGFVSASILSTALNYNIAQTHARRGEYETAKTAFETSLITMTKPNTSEVLSSRILKLQIHHNLGHCHYRLGDYKESMKFYKSSLAFTKAVDELPSFHAANAMNCIGALCIRTGSSDYGFILDLFKRCLTIFRKHYGVQSRQLGTVLNNIGRVYYLQGSYAHASMVYEESLKIRRSILGKSSIDLAVTVCNTGQTYHQLGQLDNAMQLYQEFLYLARNHCGSDNRDIAIVLKCMAQIYHARQELQEAKCLYEKALEAWKGALGSQHPELSSTYRKLGNLHFEMKDMEKALQYYSQWLTMERQLALNNPCAVNPQQVLAVLKNVAEILRNQGNFAAAFKYYSKAYALQLKILGPNHIELANLLCNMGLMQYRLKAYDASFGAYQEALLIQRDHFGSDESLDVASTLNSIGLVLFQKRLYWLAKSCFADCLRIRRKLLGWVSSEVAIVLHNVATLHMEVGDDEVAMKYFKEKLRVEQATLGTHHPDALLTLQHLGLVHQQRGELDEALHFFKRAVELERTRQTEGSRNNRVFLGKLFNLIGNIYLQKADVDNMMSFYIEALRIYHKEALPSETLVIAGCSLYGFSKLHPSCASVA